MCAADSIGHPARESDRTTRACAFTKRWGCCNPHVPARADATACIPRHSGETRAACWAPAASAVESDRGLSRMHRRGRADVDYCGRHSGDCIASRRCVSRMFSA